MPFDDLLTPVAVPAVTRHDAATCCGERQDSEDYRAEWLAAVARQRAIDEAWRAAVEPQLSSAAISAMCQRNERDALLKKNATLKAESDQQQETILHAGLEIVRLTAEVERLRLRPEEVRAVKDSIREYEDTYDVILHQNAVTLRDLLKRQGGGE